MEESTEQSKWQTNYLEEVIKENASRLEQMKAILSFVQGNDTFVALPTDVTNLTTNLLTRILIT